MTYADVLMTNPNPNRTAQKYGDEILTRAVFKAAEILKIKLADLSQILALKNAVLTDMKRGDDALRPKSDEFERAVLFVRLFSSLDTMVGGDEKTANDWLRHHNYYFDDMPINKIQNKAGLLDVIAYLDASRAPI